jgi:hypothetical protein
MIPLWKHHAMKSCCNLNIDANLPTLLIPCYLMLEWSFRMPVML